jgi:hypothetical protein
MSETKVSSLTPATTLGPTDELYLVQGGVSKKVTLATLFANVPSNLRVAGTFTMSGTQQTLLNSGVINATTAVTICSTDTPSTMTIADGLFEGQVKVVLLESAGATMILQGANVGATTITFSAAGATCQLQWLNDKWYAIGGTAVVA